MTTIESTPDAAPAESIEPNLVLDLKGLVCPVPVVKVANAIKQIEAGEIIEAEATDPGILADIPAWCQATGNQLLKIERNGKAFIFWVEKKA
jgi:TusA-related sulfurtransferase